MSGFTSESELLNMEIDSHTGSYDRTGKDSYALGKIWKVEVYQSGEWLDTVSNEKEAQEFINYEVNELGYNRSDYTTKIIYE